MGALRTCRDCGVQANSEDQLDLFRKNSNMKYGRDNHCKGCHRETGREYWKSDKGRDKRLKKYGITVQDYNRMYSEQEGCCAICGVHVLDMKDDKTFLSVDHCHSTGQVRGLLCDSCNLGLGKFYDDVERLNRAIEYLEKGKK